MRARGIAALVAEAVVVAGAALVPAAASAAEKVVLSKGHTDAAGCSSPTASSGGTSGAGTLVVATAGEPDTLSPVLNYGPVRPAPGEVVDAGDRLVLAANEK